MQQFRQFKVAGQQIAATLHIPGDTPAPGVVMCHGFTGHRIEAHFLFVKAARALCDAGLNVLRFDFRGSGESEGRFVEMTVETEITDALAALDVLRAEPTVDANRVAVLGLSLGGLVAACAAARDEVQALVLWSAVADLPDVFNARLDAAGGPEIIERDGYYEAGAHRIGRGFVETVRSVDPLAELAHWRGPALIVHGSGDETVPVEHAHRYLQTLSEDRAALHIVEGADHTFSSVAWEREVIDLSCDWLVRRLR